MNKVLRHLSVAEDFESGSGLGESPERLKGLMDYSYLYRAPRSQTQEGRSSPDWFVPFTCPPPPFTCLILS
ncbi:hypothetical protein EYF80_058543 [Liparis tanakae]|uniref:Uncharacterized protein n=1 Tax=Liparis tanakae TaxID=230148 RepID=A0A4Z2ER52_9TELE|nr:hypothetical protein EYF80_058543 [Liparis tanakae]